MTAFSDATLLGWLATKPDRLERHLDQHPEDIERLEGRWLELSTRIDELGADR